MAAVVILPPLPGRIAPLGSRAASLPSCGPSIVYSLTVRSASLIMRQVKEPLRHLDGFLEEGVDEGV